MKALTGAWPPAIVVVAGAVLSMGIGAQRRLPLRQPLDRVVPRSIEGAQAVDMKLSPEEQRVAGMSSYLARSYESREGARFSLYVGYYEQQTREHTIHSPKNCLPGAGWEALAEGVTTVQVRGRLVKVNRYLLQRASDRALVLYWYQGRGRIQHDEYAVKWNLLRDAALRRRSDEALVRVVVPMAGPEPPAEALARSIAVEVIPAVTAALPS